MLPRICAEYAGKVANSSSPYLEPQLLSFFSLCSPLDLEPQPHLLMIQLLSFSCS